MNPSCREWLFLKPEASRCRSPVRSLGPIFPLPALCFASAEVKSLVDRGCMRSSFPDSPEVALLLGPFLFALSTPGYRMPSRFQDDPHHFQKLGLPFLSRWVVSTVLSRDHPTQVSTLHFESCGHFFKSSGAAEDPIRAVPLSVRIRSTRSPLFWLAEVRSVSLVIHTTSYDFPVIFCFRYFLLPLFAIIESTPASGPP